MRDELTGKRNFPRFRLSRNAKTMLWAFAVPLILAVNCIFMRVYLETEAKAQCPPPGEGFSFDLYSMGPPSLLELGGTLKCASSQMEFFYKILGISAFLLICLSIVLPVILYLRRRPVKQPKLFDTV